MGSETRLSLPDPGSLIAIPSRRSSRFNRRRALVFASLFPGLNACSFRENLLPPPPIGAVRSAHVKTYATNFSMSEDAISEGGRWIGGRTAGLDWGHVSTGHGRAIGYAGKARYADSVALLSGDTNSQSFAHRGHGGVQSFAYICCLVRIELLQIREIPRKRQESGIGLFLSSATSIGH